MTLALLKKLTNRDATNPHSLDNRVESYWTAHNVTQHKRFASEEESFAYFDWRNDQYHDYIRLMPVSGFNGKAVLDFGCGPGPDLVGFSAYSRTQRLVGADLSATSLQEAQQRLRLHGAQVELVQLQPGEEQLPFEDESFDFIHSSGVLHHTPDPVKVLAELRRVLRRDGTMHVMVYNHDSLWLHLYVAYHRAIVQGLLSTDTLQDQFRKSTDGENCPISNCYRPHEWVALCAQAGLLAELTGVAISMHELSLFPSRFTAIQDIHLPAESRSFLASLTLDPRGFPLYRGHYAGIDACYRLTKDTR